MSKFDDTLSLIEEIERTSTPDAVCQQLLNLSSQYGLTCLLAGTLPRPRETASKIRDQNVFLNGWPMGWAERYFERNYIFIDPIATKLQSDLTAFTWDQARIDPAVATDANRMFGEATEFGLCAGFAIPFVTLEGSIASISLGGQRIDLPPRAKGMLSLISTYTMGRAIQLRNNTKQQTLYRPLTHREIEAMRWAADGKTEWEISVIMSISEHTAAKHLNNARTKLGAVNRVQAIANAIRSGIIR